MKDLAAGAGELGDIFRHLWLLRAVAAAAGADLSRAVAEGRLSPLAFSQMVTGCRGGGCSRACALWLSARSACAAAVPEFCAGAEALQRLAD